MAADELVALYDPADDTGRVTGSARRDEVRARNLPHAATAVLVRNSRGQVYLHRRTDTKDVFPGRYDVWAGGCVDAGEDPYDAARRELAEELGVTGVQLVPVFRGWYHDDSHPLPRLRLRGGLGRAGRAPARGGRRGRLGRLGGAVWPARGPRVAVRARRARRHGALPRHEVGMSGGDVAPGALPSVRHPGSRAAFVVDAALVLLFAAVGRRSHAESGAVLGVLLTAWPFLAGTVLGWVVALGWRRAAPLGVRDGIPVWVCAVAARDAAARGHRRRYGLLLRGGRDGRARRVPARLAGPRGPRPPPSGR